MVNMIQYAISNTDIPTEGELRVVELCVQSYASNESEYGASLVKLWKQREQLRLEGPEDNLDERSLLREIHLEYTKRIRNGPKRETLHSDLCYRWSSLIHEND